MILYIKYMVSLRCKLVVKAALEKMGITFRIIELGTVEIMDPFSEEQRKELHRSLLKSGITRMKYQRLIIPIISAKNYSWITRIFPKTFLK